MPTPSTRTLARVPVPPGAAGVAVLLGALASALDGSGPAIAPVPTVSASVSNAYVMSVLAALKPDDPQTPLESADVAAVIATSGSTGAPHGVLLTAAQLTAFTAVTNAGAQSKTGPPTWIAALPVTSVGGLNVLVRALAAGVDPVAMSSLGGAEPFTPRAFCTAVEQAASRSGDIRVALVPAQIARLMSDDAAMECLRACALVLVGGAPMRPSLRSAAAELGIAVTTTYGATETAGGCVFDGRPLPGVTVTADSEGEEAGVLTIHGPSIASGYRADPVLTRAHFGGDGFRTSDLGTVDAHGRVTVLGRADDVVIVNGVNVSRGAVERILDDLPDIAGAAVICVEGGDGEPEIWGFVEVREDAPNIEEVARDAVIARLGSAARPSVRRVPRLPHLPNGKVDRAELQRWATDPGRG